MLYLFSVIDDATATASDDEMAAIRALNGRMRAAGQRVFAGGLAAPSIARTIDNRDDRGLVASGATVTGPRALGPAGADRAGTDRAGTDQAVTAQAGTAQAGTDRAGTAYLSGLWIIEVPDEAAALALAAEASRACNRRVEVRAFLD
ncbi:MAG TPA: hypothetical protein PLL54_04615 [Dermatophilaceae bacterium]|nr:hypothetical protein [Dermatophilaceae bacterium]